MMKDGVTVSTQPSNPNQTCTVSNDSGTVAGVDVTDVMVICSNLYQLDVNVTGLGSVTSDPSGIDCGSTCAADFDAGSTISLMAVYDPSWTLGSWTWTGACIGGTSCVITMSEPKTANVEFKCELIQIEDNTQPEWACYQLEVVDDSGFVIDETDDVTFKAEHSVILGKGFTVKEGGVFRALMTTF